MVFMVVGVRQLDWTSHAGFSTLSSTKQINDISRTGQYFNLHTHSQLPGQTQSLIKHLVFPNKVKTYTAEGLPAWEKVLDNKIQTVARSSLQRCSSPLAIEKKHSESHLETQHSLPLWPTYISSLFN